MLRKIAILFWGLIIILSAASCEKRDEQHKDSIEVRLLSSFKRESPALQKRVAEIITNAKADDYQAALNELALLSATHNLTKEQKLAVDTLVRQLRYDMEEEIFSKQDEQPDE